MTNGILHRGIPFLLPTMPGIIFSLTTSSGKGCRPLCARDSTTKIHRTASRQHLNSVNRRLHSDETLIALSITSATSPVAARVIDGLKQLQGCDAFFSVIISSTDEALYRKLGINVCCEPKYERVSLYHR